MDRGGKILLVVAVAVVVGICALAVPAMVGVLPTVDTGTVGAPSTSPSVSTTKPTADAAELGIGPVDRPRVNIEAMCGDIPARTDGGKRYGANGTVEAVDGQGLATVYRVAPNDSYVAILERFCLNPREFDVLNAIRNVGEIYEGDVLAFTAAARTEANRLAGYDFPACPRDEYGYPEVASIGWWSEDADAAYASARIEGAPIDTGAAGTANGAVRVAADGSLIDYTVAVGDTWRGIRDRFCFDLYYLPSLTGEWMGAPLIHPGDVIPLQPQHLRLRTDA